jgi:hypothetical protein
MSGRRDMQQASDVAMRELVLVSDANAVDREHRYVRAYLKNCPDKDGREDTPLVLIRVLAGCEVSRIHRIQRSEFIGSRERAASMPG